MGISKIKISSELKIQNELINNTEYKFPITVRLLIYRAIPNHKSVAIIIRNIE